MLVEIDSNHSGITINVNGFNAQVTQSDWTTKQNLTKRVCQRPTGDTPQGV